MMVLRREENEYTEKNTQGKAIITNDKLNPHTTLVRIEPAPHWWEVSALTTLPPY